MSSRRNKDLKPALRTVCDNEGIPCTAPAIQHTSPAPGMYGSKGILVRSLWSFSALRKVLNGVQLTVGHLCGLGLAHSVFLMTNTRSLKVRKWRQWATTVGEVNNADVPKMVQAAGAAHRSHAQQALDTVVDLLDARDEESVCIDGSVLPGFGEWRLKAVKQAWSAEMAPTDRQSQEVWPALWKTNLPAITQEFIYRVPWKKLQVPQRVRLVKDINEGCVWCGA